MRIVFMGTPDLAKVCLEAVYAHPAAEIVGVLTQPDKPKGRGMKMVAPPVKVFAEEKGIPVYQPVTLKDGVFAEELSKLDPELIIVAAYGKILPAYVLDYPKYGCINAHGHHTLGFVRTHAHGSVLPLGVLDRIVAPSYHAIAGSCVPCRLGNHLSCV